MEQISDDELQRLRGEIEKYTQYKDLRHLVVPGPLARMIMDRLDAAESRVVELQREVERLLPRPVHADGCPCGKCDWEGEPC